MTDELLRSEPEAYDPDDHYPPIGTEEACLILSLSEYNFVVLGCTGRYMYGQTACAGLNGEEVGLSGVPEEPGYWVMRNGQVIDNSPWEHPGTEYCLEGAWREPTAEDFELFKVDVPEWIRRFKPAEKT